MRLVHGITIAAAMALLAPTVGAQMQDMAKAVADGGIKVTATAVNAEDKTTTTEYTTAGDGKDVPVTGSADYDMRVNLRDIQTGKAQNIKMRDGDTIFIPKAERVWVVGQVRNPQGVVFEEGMTVFEAIAAAGGITEKGSNSRIEIVRIEKGQRKSIDAKQTDLLKPGDQVNVRTRRL